LPAEVFEQLKFYDDPTWGKIPRLTYGPMFCGNIASNVIAQNFVSGLKRLVQLEKLRADSAFVSDALSALQSGNTIVAHPPAGIAENELFKALQLSLSFQINTAK